ncbi:11884_t:CDS:1 [Funneliformis mosseae]|uniref:11884_t:CDS:1 n=1 Tax=Funneliformis mosseae TaxID=27381 RepID=A0A9N8VZB9_FUNMO|nr:11884_t:CDS:1 [Funneliformis mosseae]
MSHFKSKIDSTIEEYLVDAGKYYAQKKGRRASVLELEDYKKNFIEKVNSHIKEFEKEVCKKLKKKDWEKEFNKLENKEDISSKDKWIRQARSNHIEELYSRIWKSLKKGFLSKYNKEPQEKDFMEFPKIAAVYFYRKVLGSIRKETTIKESRREESSKNATPNVITRHGFHGEKCQNINLLIDHHRERVNNLVKDKIGASSSNPQRSRLKSLNPFLQIINQGETSKKAKRLSEGGNDKENIKARKINE